MNSNLPRKHHPTHGIASLNEPQVVRGVHRRSQNIYETLQPATRAAVAAVHRRTRAGVAAIKARRARGERVSN